MRAVPVILILGGMASKVPASEVRVQGNDTRSILVVEDDAAIRETVQSVLEAEGYSVHGAAHGRAALELLETIEPPGIILLDLMMPVMNGWDFLHALRMNPRWVSIPVTIVSASAPQTPPMKDVGFMSKPMKLDKLLQIVREHCQRRAA